MNIVPSILVAALLAPLVSAQFDAQKLSSGSYGTTARLAIPKFAPDWADAIPLQVIEFDYNGSQSPQTNGANLKQVIQALQPGDRLEIGTGIYFIDSLFVIDIVATKDHPIWISSKPNASVTITRSNNEQNAVNLGSVLPARYIALQGLEITGGDVAVAMRDCENIWIDRCHIHHCTDVTITARSRDTAFLYITRNHVHHPGGTAEGIYVGSNNSAVISHDNVIAQNHVHDTNGTQGEGIEIKQGSFGNLIAENLVHDNQFPSIVVMGTDGNRLNVVERNVCYNSADHVMQVQGEAIVRNNLLMNAALSSFASGDHQGTTKNLWVLNNTMINTGRAVRLNDWSNKPGMVFANNACYSQTSDALKVSGAGAVGVTIAGNVFFGIVDGASSGWINGNGLSDFVNVDWLGTKQDARPSDTSALIGSGSLPWGQDRDLLDQKRSLPLEPGCLDRK